MATEHCRWRWLRKADCSDRGLRFIRAEVPNLAANDDVDSAERLCAEWKRCGGCPELDLSRAAQRQLHEGRIRETLSEIGLQVDAWRWIAAPSRVAYRTRVRLRLDDGVPVFFNRDKPSSCAVLSEGTHAALAEFRAFALEHRRWLRGFGHAELWEPDLDGVACAALYGSNAPSPNPAGSTTLSLWVAGGDAPAGRRMRLPMGMEGFVAPSSFHQVNTEANALLGAAITRATTELGVTSFADVYCGSGNFALPLMAAGLQGCGVEQDPVAIDCLKRTARSLSLNADKFVAGDASDWLNRERHCARTHPLVLLDPPRGGLRDAAKVAANVAKTHLVLLSCHLPAFRRDTAALHGTGMTLREVWVCDMFPNTAHAEIVSWWIH